MKKIHKNTSLRGSKATEAISLLGVCFVVLTSSALLAMTTLTIPAFASIEIDPLRLELEVDSGKVATGYISITNRGNEDINISLSPGEYRYMFSVNTIYPLTPKPQAVSSCKAWLSLKPDRIKLEKDKQQQIQYSINMPPVSKGEYVASILIDQEQPPAAGAEPARRAGEASPKGIKTDAKGQVRIKITARINIPLYVAIKNSLRRSCEIETLEAVSSKGKKFVWFSVVLKNNGTVHIRPATTLTIFDEHKTVVHKIPLGKSLPVFAGFGEKFSADWTPRFPGKHTVVATADIGTKDLLQKTASFEVRE